MSEQRCIKCNSNSCDEFCYGFCKSCWEDIPEKTQEKMIQNSIGPKPLLTAAEIESHKPEKKMCHGTLCKGLSRPIELFSIDKKRGKHYKTCDLCRRYSRDRKRDLSAINNNDAKKSASFVFDKADMAEILKIKRHKIEIEIQKLMSKKKKITEILTILKNF